MHKMVLSGLMAVFLIFAYTRCGGDGSGYDPVTVTAQLNTTDFTVATRPTVFDSMWATLIEGIAFAFPRGQKVNEVWAMPLHGGEFHPQAFKSVKKMTPNGGRVTLAADRRNWVAILLDTTASTKKAQVVKYVSMTAGSKGMSNLVLTNGGSELNLGELSIDPTNTDETKSSRGSSENSGTLSLSIEQLERFARSDDSSKTVRNAYRNLDGDKFFSVKPFFVYRWSSASNEVKNQFSSASTLVASKFLGYLFYMNSNFSSIKYSDICNQTLEMTLHPPAGQTVKNTGNTGTWTDASPISSFGGSKSTDGNSCGANQLYLRDDTAQYGSYQFNFSAGAGSGNDYLQPPIAPGDWKLKIGGTTVAEFEGAVGTIFENDDTTKPTVFIPSLKANHDGSKITSIEVEWYQRDSSGTLAKLDPVTDKLVLQEMQSVAISLTNYSTNPRTEERSSTLTPTTGYKFTPSKTWDLTSGVSIDVDYTYNNVSIHTEFRM